MRRQITLFQDQYELYKELKSPNLLVAFVEFMFEDKQPKNNQLNSLETAIFNSFIERMEKSKKLYDRNSKWWQSSHWWWRPETPVEKPTEKTAKKQPNEQPKNKEEEVEEEVYKENKKRKWFGEFSMCFLTDDEHEQVLRDYWVRNGELLISKVDNYCASKWKKYKNYVAAIRNFAKSSWIEKQATESRNESWIYDLPF